MYLRSNKLRYRDGSDAGWDLLLGVGGVDEEGFGLHLHPGPRQLLVDQLVTEDRGVVSGPQRIFRFLWRGDVHILRFSGPRGSPNLGVFGWLVGVGGGANDRVVTNRRQDLSRDRGRLLSQIGGSREKVLEVGVGEDAVIQFLTVVLHGYSDSVVKGGPFRDQCSSLTEPLDL